MIFVISRIVFSRNNVNIDKINLNLLRHVRKIFKNGRKDLGNFELFMKTSEILKKLLEI